MWLTPAGWSRRGEASFPEPHDRTTLIWQGIPGERCLARLEHRGEHQNYAKWVRAESPAPQRVDPPCDKYSQCGGCPWMHLSPDGQADARTQMVRSALDAVGIDAPITAFHKSPDGQAGFRHVVKVVFGESDEGRLRMGAPSRNRKHTVAIPDCLVAAPILRKAMDAVAFHAIDLGMRPYDAARDFGLLRYAVLRASRTTGEVLLTLICSRYDRSVLELAERVGRQVNEVVGIWLHVNDGPGNAIFARDGDGVVGVSPLLGKATVEEKLNDITYDVGSGDFFQTNPAVAAKLYERAVVRGGLGTGVPFVDLYSGVGGIALQAARVTGWALGVEEIDGAVTRARDAARKNALNAEFVAGPVKVILAERGPRLAPSRPVVCVDPARRGLEDGVAEAILALNPRRVVYVSCNAQAMARDLLVFRDKGYTLGEVELFDMFPHASHVEALVTLDPPDAEDAVNAARAPRRKRVGAAPKAESL